MWTTERPTTAGYWYFKETDVDEWRVVEIRLRTTTDSHRVHFTNGRVESMCHLTGEWQPVQGPVES